MKNRFKKISFFMGAIAISLIGASYRFLDVATAKGELRIDGGEAKPVLFQSGLRLYTLFTKIVVTPSVKGDVKVELHGNPEMSYRIYNYKAPVIDLGLSDFYRLEGSILRDVRSGGKPIYLYIFLYPPSVDPVCGMPYNENFLSKRHRWKTYYFCSETCLNEFNKAAEKYKDKDGLKREYALVFYDARTGNNLLNVPIIFNGKEKMGSVSGGHVH